MKRFSQIPIVALALMMMATIASAQHLISSKAGFVNRAEGKVFILRQDSENGERGRASLGTQMRDGDRIMTEADSRTELLLSPGSYLRLNENSEVRAVSTSFMQMRFELVKGSIITEISTSTEQVSTINKNNPVELVTPHGIVSIAKDGLFRFDIAQAITLVQVRQGELALGAREQFLSGKASKVGRGKAIRLDGRNAAKDDVAKIDKDVADQFDVWSFGRAQTLMAANLSALRRSRTTSPMSYGWMYDSFYNCYTFIPGRGLYYSPYGFGFFNSFGSMYGYYPYGYYPYYPSNGYGGGFVTPNIPPRVISGNDRTPVRRETEGRRVDNSSAFGDRGDYSSSRSVSTSSSSVSAPVSVSAPAPARSDSGDGGRAPAPTRP
ncbi:MAG: FecR family protein [Blastocatellia bacterium]